MPFNIVVPSSLKGFKKANPKTFFPENEKCTQLNVLQNGAIVKRTKYHKFS